MVLPSLSKAPNFPGPRPDRRRFARWVHRYSLIVSVLLSAIVALAAGPFAPALTLITLSCFWGYQIVEMSFMRRMRLQQMPLYVHRLRTLGLVCATSGFLLFLRRASVPATIPSVIDWLDLLYVPALFIVIRYDRSSWVAGMFGLAAAMIVAIEAFTAPVWRFDLFQLIGVRLLWLGLVTFMIHVFVRIINDRSASLSLLHTLPHAELEWNLHAQDDEYAVLQRVADRVATEFNYLRVHVLRPLPAGSMRCVAGAGEKGCELVNQVLPLKDTEGIVGYALRTNQTQVENNVARTPHYVALPGTYTDTQSEMAVPFTLGGEHFILDIQDPRRNAFLEQDQEVMETLVRQLGQSLDGLRLLRTQHEIRHLVESIARQFLGHHEKASLLNKILEAAHTAFGADPAVLYEYHPRHHTIRVEALKGILRYEDDFSLTVSRTTHVAYRVLHSPQDSYFHDSVSADAHDPLFRPDRTYTGQEEGCFVDREGIASRAVFRLRAGDDAVGVLFLNFRAPRLFTPEQRKQMCIFADLAALAIQKAQLQEQQLQTEREEAGRAIQQSSEGRLRDIQRLACAVRSSQTIDPRSRMALNLIVDSSTGLLQDVAFFRQEWEVRPLPYLQHELHGLAQRIKNRFNVPVALKWTGMNPVLSLSVINQLRIVVADIAFTAIRRHEATYLNVHCALTEKHLSLWIEENGDVGAFDLGQADSAGTLRHRIGHLGGTIDVLPMYPVGLRVTIHGIQLFHGGHVALLEQSPAPHRGPFMIPHESARSGET